MKRKILLFICIFFLFSGILAADEDEDFYQQDDAATVKKKQKVDTDLQRMEDIYGKKDEENKTINNKQKTKIDSLIKAINELLKQKAELLARKDGGDDIKKKLDGIKKEIKTLKKELFALGGEDAIKKLDEEFEDDEEITETDDDVIIFDDEDMTRVIGSETLEDRSRLFDKMKNKQKKTVTKLEEKKSIANIEGFEQKVKKNEMYKLGMWIGAARDSEIIYNITDKEKYAGKNSLYVEYVIGEDIYNNWINISK